MGLLNLCGLTGCIEMNWITEDEEELLASKKDKPVGNIDFMDVVWIISSLALFGVFVWFRG